MKYRLFDLEGEAEAMCRAYFHEVVGGWPNWPREYYSAIQDFFKDKKSAGFISAMAYDGIETKSFHRPKYGGWYLGEKWLEDAAKDSSINWKESTRYGVVYLLQDWMSRTSNSVLLVEHLMYDPEWVQKQAESENLQFGVNLQYRLLALEGFLVVGRETMDEDQLEGALRYGGNLGMIGICASLDRPSAEYPDGKDLLHQTSNRISLAFCEMLDGEAYLIWSDVAFPSPRCPLL